jgi:nucleoside-diphosphate-sugar epimerase
MDKPDIFIVKPKSAVDVLTADLEYFADNIPGREAFANSCIAVTGATGYVGSMLVRALLHTEDKYGLGIKVIGLVRSVDKAQNILGELCSHPALAIEEVDLIGTNIPQIKAADYVIHTAAVTASKMMVECPVDTIESSLLSTRNILEAAVGGGKLRSLVYISSMELYGVFAGGNSDVHEDELGYLDISKIRSDYPECKRMCEMMCLAYSKQYGINAMSARLAQTFGTGLLPTENRVFAQFARSVINRTDIVLHTSGASEGNYCYVSDALLGIIYILLLGSSGEAYNVSNPRAHISIKAMAEMCADELASGKIKVVMDIPESDTAHGYAPETHLKLNSDKLQALGWKPTVDLKEAYERMIQSLI